MCRSDNPLSYHLLHDFRLALVAQFFANGVKCAIHGTQGCIIKDASCNELED